jgi:hypothetical protein
MRLGLRAKSRAVAGFRIFLVLLELCQCRKLVLAFILMLVFVADGAGRSQLTLQIASYGSFGVSLCSDDDFDPFFVKNIDCASAHTTGNDDAHALVMQEYWQKSGPVSWIGDKHLVLNLIVIDLKDGKALTVAEMFRYPFAFACDCDFHNALLLYPFI